MKRDKPLGVRGKQVLEQITLQTSTRGYPPLCREIASAMGVSRALVRQVLDDLADRKMVTWEPNQPRTLRVVEVK